MRILHKYVLSCLLTLIFLCFPLQFWGQQRETDVGTSLSVEISKSLNRFFDLSLEEELRLVSNNSGFDRLSSTIGVDYSMLDRKLKAGIYYSYLYLYNSDFYYENRHRYYASLSYKESVGSFTLSWRGRFQTTCRDEDRGEYKINPKYVLRNKLDVEYTIFGSPWKPFVSAEIFNTLNDPYQNEIYKIRFQTGTSWRINRSDYMEFFLRADEYFVGKDPRVFSVGAAFKKKF